VTRAHASVADLSGRLAPHHVAAVDGVVARYAEDGACVALLLVGSLAHGNGRPGSDVDVVLVATEEVFEARRGDGGLAFVIRDLAGWPGGYVDVKVTSRSMLERVAQRGSDPARYAFRDAVVLATRDPSIGVLLERAARFPSERRAERQRRFLCQLLAWTWYLEQAEEHANAYLTTVATHKLVLFACRVVLNANEALFPYHKWLLRETERVPRRPEGFADLIAELLARPSAAAAQRLKDAVLAFAGEREANLDWPNQFVVDSELNWLEHEAPVDDL
jgi:hypothetical protein